MAKSPLTYVDPKDPPLKRGIIHALEMVTGKRDLTRRYRVLQNTDLKQGQVWARALELLEINTACDGFPLTSIPREGPLVFIANHPFGVVDGLIMGKIAAETRTHFSMLVNAVLGGQDPRIEKNLLPIDFGETKEAARLNIATRQLAITRLVAGEAIVIFPSGAVATADQVFGKAKELEWKRFTAQLIQRSQATVVPIFFHGQNSPLFHLASKVGPSVRLGLLIHEVRNKRRKTIRVTIGTPISYAALMGGKRQDIMEKLKALTLGLSQ